MRRRPARPPVVRADAPVVPVADGAAGLGLPHHRGVRAAGRPRRARAGGRLARRDRAACRAAHRLPRRCRRASPPAGAAVRGVRRAPHRPVGPARARTVRPRRGRRPRLLRDAFRPGRRAAAAGLAAAHGGPGSTASWSPCTTSCRTVGRCVCWSNRLQSATAPAMRARAPPWSPLPRCSTPTTPSGSASGWRPARRTASSLSGAPAWAVSSRCCSCPRSIRAAPMAATGRPCMPGICPRTACGRCARRRRRAASPRSWRCSRPSRRPCTAGAASRTCAWACRWPTAAAWRPRAWSACS